MQTYFTFENIYRAYQTCKRRKSNTLNHLQFAEHLEHNIYKLRDELLDRTYKPGRSIAFIVEKPKIREIFAADFRDRVVHHLLCSYLEPIFEKQFIYDSWACRTDKGTHRAMLRVKSFSNRLKHSNTYYLKMDIKSFFTSIDQSILYELVARKVKNEELLWLTKIIIFHDCAHDIAPKIQSLPSLFDKLPTDKSLFTVARGKGLPIGNLTSQFFANVYLNELDQYVKHSLKARNYVRYVDDILILGNNKEELLLYKYKISKFVQNILALTVHPEKQFIGMVTSGIDFVGYIIRPEYVLIRKRIANDWRRAISETGLSDKKRMMLHRSYCAHAVWANGRGLTIKHGSIVTKLLIGP